MTTTQKLALIKRLAQQHATAASNVGAHRLAVRVLEIVNSTNEGSNDDSNSKTR